MTIIINHYIGITHPISGNIVDNKHKELVFEAWRRTNCPNGIHLFDEVLSNNDHYLHCDACGIDVHIAKVVIPDGKEDIVGNSPERPQFPDGPELVEESEIK